MHVLKFTDVAVISVLLNELAKTTIAKEKGAPTAINACNSTGTTNAGFIDASTTMEVEDTAMTEVVAACEKLGWYNTANVLKNSKPGTTTCVVKTWR